MKGMLFTEFFEMVESTLGSTMLDDIIDDCQLSSGGAYTAVGTYPHEEMVALVQALALRTQTPVPVLLKTFGEYLFGRFVLLYPQLFTHVQDAFPFLCGVDAVIHAEVHKLYPDAQLPRFDVYRLDDCTLRMEYSSPRGMADLAEGLLLGCIHHYGETIALHREPLPKLPGGACFTLTKVAP